MQRIAVLGSTGSIGVNTLDIIRHFPGEFSVVALSAHARTDVLLRQVGEFLPRYVCVTDDNAAEGIGSKLPRGTNFFSGSDGLQEMVSQGKIDKVIVAISGAAALPVVWKALDSVKVIALANKEALVMAGSHIMKKAVRKKALILPIDSEQSAIWQCLSGEDRRTLRRIYLTASGGPLRTRRPEELAQISIDEVLKHPRWNMGKKITVDSSTLMNKGLELLETIALFDVSADRTTVVIHPESIIHSMVEFVDGVVMAQLSVTDMRIPIQYALSYPRRLENELKPLNFHSLEGLHFEKPDVGKFPCLRLAYEVARNPGTSSAVLNAANEVAVDAFLNGRLKFTGIPKLIER